MAILKNRRKVFLIYKPVQILILKVITASCFLSIFSVVAGTALFYSTLTGSYFDTEAEGIYQAIHLINNYSNIYFMYVALSILFTSGLIIYSWLKLSHKIAGPLFRIRSNLRNYVDGTTPDFESIKLRKNDELQDLADLINQAINKNNST